MTSPNSKILYIKLGTACNSHCLFCAVSETGMQPFLTRNEVLDRLEIGHSCGAAILSISGGEPTLRDDLVDIVGEARRLGFEGIQIQSNGRRLAKRRLAQSLIDAGADIFIIPLHGHKPELHDHLTQAQGGMDETCRGIRNLVSIAGTSGVLGNVVITQQNQLYLGEIVEQFLELSVSDVLLTFVQPDGRAARHAADLIPRLTDIAPRLKQVVEDYSNRCNLSISEVPECIAPALSQYLRNQVYEPTESLAQCRGYTVFSVLHEREEITDLGTVTYPGVIRIEQDSAPMRLDDLSGDFLKGSKCKDCPRNTACPGVRKG